MKKERKKKKRKRKGFSLKFNKGKKSIRLFHIPPKYIKVFSFILLF